MGMLLKYELRKTWIAKALVLGITAAAEIFFLISIAIKNYELVGVAAILLALIAIGGVLLIGVQSILTLHRDMNTKQSYMLFMTPHSSYKILGAKVIENGLSLVLAGGFFLALALVDWSTLLVRFGSLEDLWEYATTIIHSIDNRIRLDAQGLALAALNLIASWLATVSIAYLADIISSALLNGKKYNGMLTFVLFILLSVLLGWLQRLPVTPGMVIDTVFLIEALIALGFTGVMYLASAQVMGRFLSV